MQLKSSSVKIDNLSQEIKSKFNEIDKIFLKYAGREAIITSGNDSEHSGFRYWKKLSRADIKFDDNLFRALKSLEYQVSLHYFNKAIDLRIKDIPIQKIDNIIADLRIIFPKPAFDILDELDHIHIEENIFNIREIF